MDLKRLRYFCAVVEQGNITKAARALNMAQPPLSKRLRELEDEVGAALFIRQGHKIETTLAGDYLYRRAGEILRSVEETTQQTALIARNQKKTICIGLSHLFQDYFRDLLIEMHQRYPDVEINVFVSDSSHLENLLAIGAIDVALIQRPQNADEFNCINMTPIKLVAVVSETLCADMDGDTLNFLDVADFPLILMRKSSGTGTYEDLITQFRKGGRQPNIIMRVSQPHMVLDWLSGGLEAACLLPTSEVCTRPLRGYRVFDIFPPPLVFFPSVVKLTTAPHVPELLSLLERGYPFPVENP